MNRNFARSLALVLKYEGGFSNNPKDPGGATMKGITLATYRRLVNPNATVADLKRISDAEVAKIYKTSYWDVIRGDDLPDGVDFAVFDFAVNSGPQRAVQHLQSAVGAPIDGRVGPLTIGAAGRAPIRQTINRVCDGRLAFLKTLSGWSTFGNGWQRRVESVRAEASGMVGQGPIASPTPIPAPANGFWAWILSFFRKEANADVSR